MTTVKVRLDQKAQELAKGDPEMEVAAPIVREALYSVSRSYPSLRLFNCEGEMRSIFKVLRNDQPATLDESLNTGDLVSLNIG